MMTDALNKWVKHGHAESEIIKPNQNEWKPSIAILWDYVTSHMPKEAWWFRRGKINY